MKKPIKNLIFLLLTVSFGCQADKDCQQPPCPRPNINDLIFGEGYKEATLNFKVLLSDEQSNEITKTEIERFLTQDECGCADYQLSTLVLDGQIVEINSKNFILNL